MSLEQNAVAHTFTFLSFGEDGPVEEEDRRHFYFTMRSVKTMYERGGVDEDALEKAIEKEEVKEGADLPVAENGTPKISVSQGFGAGMTLVWAGLLEEAKALGEDLTVEDVGSMMGDGENAREAMEAAAKALSKFMDGLSDEQRDALEEIAPGEEGASPKGKAGKGRGE